MSYIFQHTDGTWYLRINRTSSPEYRKSLGTTNREEAYKRLPDAYREAMKELGL